MNLPILNAPQELPWATLEVGSTAKNKHDIDLDRKREQLEKQQQAVYRMRARSLPTLRRGKLGAGFGFIGHGHTNVYNTVTQGLGPAPNLAVARIGGNCATYAAPNGAVH
ncbi:hypothetical protein [Pseudomonas sp. GOM6]|uniref:hypothetical protein n=1 Tax=Pseudomonas sp. GOM6 TaxID=3036944 RepID=UPI002409CD51|nr:hypothetical protein [Pseudomonas sp. GOM6]MDG1580550.1 hypothetical protein [Pseudomonas sp. GOM6]